MRINTNMAALNAWRNLSVNGGNMQKSLEKLSSGFRINRAADDAAGLAVSEKMRAQIRGTNMAIRNAQDGISLVQTAEGALTETHSILQRMRELSVQASTGTLNADDTAAIQEEVTSLTAEINRISSATKFNGRSILAGGTVTAGGTVGGAAVTGADLTAANGLVGGTSAVKLDGAQTGAYTISSTVAASGESDVTVSFEDGNGVTKSQTITVTIPVGADTEEINFNELGLKLEVNSGLGSGAGITANNAFTVAAADSSNTVQVGANNNASEQITVGIANMSVSALGLTGLNVTTNATGAIDALDAAIKSVSQTRAKLGATQNRLEHTVSNLQVTSENLSSAESRIRDVDMASEMATFTKNNILQQASTSMLAQANQSTQGILSLLR